MKSPTTGRRSAPASKSYRAKVFRNGGSQAIRLPRECRVEGTEVSVRRKGKTLVITALDSTWNTEFRQLFLEGPPRDDFPTLRELRRGLGRARDIAL